MKNEKDLGMHDMDMTPYEQQLALLYNREAQIRLKSPEDILRMESTFHCERCWTKSNEDNLILW